MNVLHVNTHASAGGAAIAAKRLHESLLAQGVDSHMAVLDNQGDTPNVSLLGGKFSRRIVRPLILRAEAELFDVLCTRPQHPAYTTFSLTPSRNHTRLNALPKDILHLHWVGEGFLSPFSLGRLQGPVVWTMHDTWPFTGGCHFPSESCCRYNDSCGQCPELSSCLHTDLSRIHWKSKRHAVKKIQPTIIALSKAFAQMAKQSGMLRDCRIEHIPNCINIDIFKPVSKVIAREALTLPQDEHIILFGAPGATSDHRKGFDLLQDALQRLLCCGRGTFRALIFGADQSETALPCTTHFLGRLHDTISLRLAYSAADVFVCPSRQDNLPNTIMEAMACGTPVAAFSVGGIPDMVEHKVTGWLAPPQDTESLAQGIAYILENDERRIRMGEAARRVVEERYAGPVVAARYMALYHDVLGTAPKL